MESSITIGQLVSGGGGVVFAYAIWQQMQIQGRILRSMDKRLAVIEVLLKIDDKAVQHKDEVAKVLKTLDDTHTQDLPAASGRH